MKQNLLFTLFKVCCSTYKGRFIKRVIECTTDSFGYKITGRAAAEEQNEKSKKKIN